jgi:hypothetical protein
MKKILLAMGLLGLSSFHLQAASCIGSTWTLGSLGLAGCDLTNGPNTWNLNNFHQSAPASGTLSGLVPANINVAFALWGQGFSVTFSREGNFEAGTGQVGFLETNFRIGGNTGTALLQSYGAVLTLGSNYNEAPNSPDFGAGPTVALDKYVQALANTTIQTLLTANNVSIPGTLTSSAPPVPIASGLLTPTASTLVIVDRLTVTGNFRPGAVASSASYVNRFAPLGPSGLTEQVPEPLTFSLMGGGLVGLAILRRRR